MTQKRYEITPGIGTDTDNKNWSRYKQNYWTITRIGTDNKR